MALIGVEDSTGHYLNLGNQSRHPSPIVVNYVRFLRFWSSTFNFSEWIGALPEILGGTVDLTMNDFEEFDLRFPGHIRSLGFDLVDPDGDESKFNEDGLRIKIRDGSRHPEFILTSEFKPSGSIIPKCHFSTIL